VGFLKMRVVAMGPRGSRERSGLRLRLSCLPSCVVVFHSSWWPRVARWVHYLGNRWYWWEVWHLLPRCGGLPYFWKTGEEDGKLWLGGTE
jgi:hypothetical protein